MILIRPQDLFTVADIQRADITDALWNAIQGKHSFLSVEGEEHLYAYDHLLNRGSLRLAERKEMVKIAVGCSGAGVSYFRIVNVR